MGKYNRVSRASQKTIVRDQQCNVTLENPNVSAVKSLEFMKQLTVVAVSTIAYLRDIFPADVFSKKMMAGEQVFVVKGSDEVPGTKTLISWMKGAFKLVHSHHLKKMIFVISKESSTLEAFTFTFSYNEDAICYDVLGEADGREVILEQSQGLPEDIAKSVRTLMRSILVHSNTLDPLPNGCEVCVKLHVDENTPEDVLPQLFQRSPADDVLNFPAEAETLKLGKVKSKFTTFSVSSKSVLREFQAYVNQEENVACQEDEEEEVPSSQMEPYRMSSLALNVNQFERNNLMENKAPENDSNTTNLSEKLSIVSLKEKTICCICECSDLCDDTIKCTSCSTFQHKACYKLLECHKVEAHICINCHNPSQRKICSLPDLLNDVNKKEAALYRQALMYCCNSSQVSTKRIMTHLKVTRQMAEKIFQQLDTDGFLHPAINKGLVRNVKLDMKENMGRYFIAPSSADSISMDIEHSPTSGFTQVNDNSKRQLSEDKENMSAENVSPQPKRRRKFSTDRNLKSSFVNY